MKPHLVLLAAVSALAGLGTPSIAASPRASGLPTREDAPRLIATLEKTDASVAEKALACQFLAIVGSADAIPALLPLLEHPQLAVQARNVLQNLPGPEAGAALRAALSRLQGPLLGGVVNTLGLRRDAEAVPALLALEQSPLARSLPETLLALGRIASPPALDILRQRITQGPLDQGPAATEACILAAEALVSDGRRTAAVEFFELARNARITIPPLEFAAFRGSVLARGDAGIPLLVEWLRSGNAARQELAARVARELPGAAVARTIAAELERSTDSVRVLILGALADRADSAVTDAVDPLAASEDPAVRVAAVQALGYLGSSAQVPTLLRSLGKSGAGDDPESSAALESLQRLGGADTDRAILQALTASPATVRARLASVVGFRQIRGSTDLLLGQAGDPNVEVAKAAFDALAAVATPDELPRVVPVAIHRTDDSVRDRAERSVYAICLKQPDATRRSEPLAHLLPLTSSVSGRASLLQIMAMLGDQAGSRAIALACDNPSAETRDTALRLLVNWPDASPVPTLLRIFKSTPNDVHRTLALRGVVTLSSLWAGEQKDPAKRPRRPPAESIVWLTEANAAVRSDPEERRILLSGLGDLNCAEGLHLLAPYLDDPSVQKDAEAALLRAAGNVAGTDDRTIARPLLEKISQRTRDPEVRRRTEELLEKN